MTPLKVKGRLLANPRGRKTGRRRVGQGSMWGREVVVVVVGS